MEICKFEPLSNEEVVQIDGGTVKDTIFGVCVFYLVYYFYALGYGNGANS